MLKLAVLIFKAHWLQLMLSNLGWWGDDAPSCWWQCLCLTLIVTSALEMDKELQQTWRIVRSLSYLCHLWAVWCHRSQLAFLGLIASSLDRDGWQQPLCPTSQHWKLASETIRTQLNGAFCSTSCSFQKAQTLHQTSPANLIFCSLLNSLICLPHAPADGPVKRSHMSEAPSLGNERNPLVVWNRHRKASELGGYPPLGCFSDSMHRVWVPAATWAVLRT